MKLLKRLREHPILRYVSYAIAISMAIVAAAIVALFTVDLGPLVRGRAEAAASKQIERPVHIGSLKIQLFSGRVLVENLRP